MKNFIRTEDGKFINLRAVSNVNVLKDKIVLNMNFTYTNRKEGQMSHFYFLKPFEDDIFETEFFKENFVRIEGFDRIVYINKNEVSHIIGESKEGQRDKIIICFCNSVSRKSVEDKSILCPEYMYISLDYNQDLNKTINHLIEELDK